MTDNIAIAYGVTIENAVGGAGDDVITGNSVDNNLVGGNGNDSISGGAGADTLKGNNGVDTLFGGNGIDLLEGGNGDDVLNGGAGNDRLLGGNGADKFAFTDAGTDTIGDFKRGTDKIDLTGLTGVERNDVSISNGKVFVDLDNNGFNAATDLTIIVQGSTVQTTDIIFG